MGLTQNQIDEVNKWINSHVDNKACRGCGSNRMTPGDIVIVPRVIHEGKEKEVISGGIPMLILICDKCAEIRLYAAVTMGLVSS